MTHDDHTLAELGAITRASDPPSISPADRDAMLEAALDRAALEPPARSAMRRRLAWPAGALAVAAGALLAIFGARAVSGAGETNALTLASGDRVYTTEGTQIAIEEGDAARRALRVVEGEALFDVVPLGPNGSFEVSTEELTVRVRGTVFVVERRARTTSVRVHEGRVEIDDRGARLTLGAGESYRSGRARERRAGEGALASLGREVAARRDAARAEERAAARDEAPRPERPEPLEAAAPALTATIASPAEPAPSSAARAPSPRPESERLAADSIQPSRAVDTRAPLADIEAMLAVRAFAAALDAARAHRGWRARMLEAHALVGLDRHAEAALVYEDVARTAAAAARPEAAYRAASLRSRVLSDPRGALAALDMASFVGTGLEERALGMRALALDAAGQRDAARRTARTYLDRHPEGGLAEDLRALAD